MAFSCTCYKSLSVQQTVSRLHRLGLLGFLSSKNFQRWEQGCLTQLKTVILPSPPPLCLTSVHSPFLSSLLPTPPPTTPPVTAQGPCAFYCLRLLSMPSQLPSQFSINSNLIPSSTLFPIPLFSTPIFPWH